jgi:hypothetical protein
MCVWRVVEAAAVVVVVSVAWGVAAAGRRREGKSGDHSKGEQPNNTAKRQGTFDERTRKTNKNEKHTRQVRNMKQKRRSMSDH